MLGIGWNFLFIGATTLLTRSYSVEEKAKVQALNDFLVFGTVAMSGLCLGRIAVVSWLGLGAGGDVAVCRGAGGAVLWWRTCAAAAAQPRFSRNPSLNRKGWRFLPSR